MASKKEQANLTRVRQALEMPDEPAQAVVDEAVRRKQLRDELEAEFKADVRKSGQATARYKKLVQSIGQDLGMVYGWKTRAAEILGVNPSYVSKVLADEVATVGPDILFRATVRLNLARDFFTNDERAFALGRGQPSHVVQLATDVLVAASSGTLSAPMVSTLASLVLSDRTVVLAFETQNAINNRLERGVELARHILAEAGKQASESVTKKPG